MCCISHATQFERIRVGSIEPCHAIYFEKVNANLNGNKIDKHLSAAMLCPLTDP